MMYVWDPQTNLNGLACTVQTGSSDQSETSPKPTKKTSIFLPLEAPKGCSQEQGGVLGIVRASHLAKNLRGIFHAAFDFDAPGP